MCVVVWCWLSLFGVCYLLFVGRCSMLVDVVCCVLLFLLFVGVLLFVVRCVVVLVVC